MQRVYAITGILLYVLIFYVLMDRVPYRRIGYLMIVWFSIEGARIDVEHVRGSRLKR